MIERAHPLSDADRLQSGENIEPHAVTLGDIPASAMQKLEDRRANFFYGEEEQPAFQDPLVIEYPDGSKTFIASAVRPENDIFPTRREGLFFVDLIGDNVLGFGDVWKDPDMFPEPFIGLMYNSESSGNKSLMGRRVTATRRMNAMRALTEAHFGQVLYSGEIRPNNEKVRAYWERLVAAGVAEKTGEPNRPDEFRFKKLADKGV